MHQFNNYFGGVHFFWWFIWIIFITWNFVALWVIPGHRRKKQALWEILK